MHTPARIPTFAPGPVVLLVAMAIAPPASAASENVLRVASPSVPLVKEGIVAHIDHRYAITDHHQVARNAAGVQSEGSYLLATSERSVVTRFSYWNGNEPIHGELFEREAATRMYDTVTRARRDPGVLEEVAPEHYRYRIFPFEAGEMKRIEVRWETWLPARGRVVEYRAPLAIPQSSVVVVLGESLRGVVVHSPSHDIVVEPAPHGETRVRTVAPRTANATELVLQYELPGTSVTAPTTFADLENNGDAFVVVDFTSPDRIVDQVKLEIEGATGVLHAAPLPATLANERATLAFRCRPNPGGAPIRAKLTGNIDGRPTVIMKETIDISSRARLVPWASTLWAVTRAKHLAVESAKLGAPPGSREEILELAFKHDMTTPFSAFFAIPASEASRVQGQLADAHRRKRWLAADASGTASFSGSSVDEADMARPAPAVERMAPGSGGCAGCVTSPRGSTGSFAGSLLLAALVSAAVRRRRASRAYDSGASEG